MGWPAANDSGKLILNFFDGEGSTAAFVKRIEPRKLKSNAAPADHHAAKPRKSRRGIASGSRRDRALSVGLASMVMGSSIPCESSLAPWRLRRRDSERRRVG